MPNLQQNSVWRPLSFCVMRCAQIINWCFHTFVASFLFQEILQKPPAWELGSPMCFRRWWRAGRGFICPFLRAMSTKMFRPCGGWRRSMETTFGLGSVLPQPGWAAEESPIVKRFQSWTLLEAAGISGVWGRIRYTLDIWYVCLLLLNLERGWTLNEVFFGKRQWCQSLCCAHGYTSQLCHTDTRIHMNTPDFVVASSCYHFAAFQHVLSCCECCAVLVCVIPSLPFSARVIACIWSYGITIVATSIIYLDQPVVRFLDQPARKFDVQIFFHFSSSVWSVPNSCHYEPQHHPKGSSIQGAGRLAMGGRGEWYRQHRNQSWQY